jgi:hypothetical protein
MRIVALSACLLFAACNGGISAQTGSLTTDDTLDTTGIDVEDCTDGYDNDQNGQTDCADPACASVCDADGDGSVSANMGGDDCDDNNPAVHPEATEICDDLDNDCDTLIDEEDDDLDASTSPWYADFDGDGYGNDTMVIYQCDPPGGASTQVGGDCNDEDATVSPAETEICDGIDNNCDNLVDDADPLVDLTTAPTWFADSDGDGFGDAAVFLESCTQPFGYVANDTDCDDTDPLSSQAEDWWSDADNDGFGAGIAISACGQPSGFVSNNDDCDDTDNSTFPGAYDICGDGIDRNCDGLDCGGCNNAPFTQPSYAATVTFTEATVLEQTRMGITWDGAEYWAASGGGSSGNRVANHDAAGTVLNYYQPGYDMRAVFTMGDGNPPVYGRAYSSSSIMEMTAPGTFSNFTTLVGGSLDVQASIAWDETNAHFVAAYNGTIDRWDINGTHQGSVTLQGWGVGTEGSYPQNRGVAWSCDHYLTYADGTLSAWDMSTGVRVATTTLTSAGTSFDSYFSFSYADELFFVLDAAGGTWRGYEIF